MARPIKPVPVDTSCCAGYKDFTFSGVNFPLSTTVLNSTASNYIHGEVTTPGGLAEFLVTIPSLAGFELNELNTQIFGSTLLGTDVIPIFDNDNTVTIQWADLGAITGTFTVRIWINNVQPA